MNPETAIFQVTSKLPGYLFVLTSITNIGDKIYLNCSSDCFCFTVAMLREVGIQIDTSHDSNRKYHNLLIIDSPINFEKICMSLKETECSIIYIKETNADGKISANMPEFVIRYPHCIIIVDNVVNPLKNNFSILINTDNAFYSKIKNHSLRFGNG